MNDLLVAFLLMSSMVLFLLTMVYIYRTVNLLVCITKELRAIAVAYFPYSEAVSGDQTPQVKVEVKETWDEEREGTY